MTVVKTVLAALIIFGVLIFSHEFGHFITAKLCGIKVNEFAVGMGPAIFKKQKGETLYSLRALPIGGFNSLEGEDEDSDAVGAFSKAPVSSRILVIIAGATMNFIVGFLILTILTATSANIASTTISFFYDDAATHESGLQIGDTIISIDGRRMLTVDDIVYELARIKDAKADFVVERNGERVTLNDVTFDSYYDEELETNQVILDFKVYAKPKTFANVMKESALWTLSVGRSIFVSIVDLLTGHVSVNQLSGPVGIVSVISESASRGMYYVSYLAAFISVNLGIVNLLPLPALDGGRLLLLVFEAIFRRKINPKYEAVINIVGMVLLLGLMMFVTYNDISKLIR